MDQNRTESWMFMANIEADRYKWTELKRTNLNWTRVYVQAVW